MQIEDHEDDGTMICGSKSNATNADFYVNQIHVWTTALESKAEMLEPIHQTKFRKLLVGFTA